MNTNLAALLLTVFSTNTVTRWPQKQIDLTNGAPIGSIVLTVNPPRESLMWPTALVDDTDATNKTVETTVTRQRLLSYEFEGKAFTNLLSDETVEHREADWILVHTNLPFIIPMSSNSAWLPYGMVFDHVDEALHMVELYYPTTVWEEPRELTNDYIQWSDGKWSHARYKTNRFIGRRNLPINWPNWMTVTNWFIGTNDRAWKANN